MEFFAVFERFRNEYPTMSAGSLVALGATLGFAFGWIFFRQQVATLKDRNEHLKDALVGRIQVPKETPEPFPACSALAALSSRASKTSSGVA